MDEIDTIIKESIVKVLNEAEYSDSTTPPSSATDLWLRYMQYFEKIAKHMKKRYEQSVRMRRQITEEEFDRLNDKIHVDLDEMATY